MSVPSGIIGWYDPRREPGSFAARIVSAMRHPWVASYGLGFGPPLTRLHPKVVAALEGKRSAFERLEVYVREALYDLDRQIELGRKNDELWRRVGAPGVDPSLESWRALDLELRLHHPESAPAAVAAELAALGPFPAREKLESRFLVRLDDPFGAVLAHRNGLPFVGQMLEHRVHPEALPLWRAFAERQAPPLGTIV